MPPTAARTFLLALVALALLPASAHATFDVARGGVLLPNSSNNFVFGSTGGQFGLLNDLGFALLNPNGVVLDRRTSSWMPGTTTELPSSAAVGANGDVWVGANAGGNYTFADIIPGVPLQLRDGPCANGVLTVDLPQNAFVFDLEFFANKLYAVGSVASNVLFLRLNPTTCQIEQAKQIDPFPASTEPAQAYSLSISQSQLFMGGRWGQLALLLNTDLNGNLDGTFDGDGAVPFDPDPATTGYNNLFRIGVVGSSIYSVGTAGASGAGFPGAKSLIGRYAVSNGAIQNTRLLDLAGTPQLESLYDIGYWGGDGFAVGQGYDDDSTGATMVRFNLSDLSADNACDDDGQAFFDFGDMSNAFSGLEIGTFAFGVGAIDNGPNSFDFFKVKFDPGCDVRSDYAGGLAGNRIPLAGARTLGVRRAVGGGGNGGGDGDGTTPPSGLPIFSELEYRDFFDRGPGRARIDLRRGRIGPFEVVGPEIDLVQQELFQFRMVALYRQLVAEASQQGKPRRRVRVARARFNVEEGAERRVFLKLRRKGKRALRRARGRRLRIQLRLNVTNQAGEKLSFKRSHRLRVRRPKG